MVFLAHTLEHIVNPCDFILKCIETFGNQYFFVEVPSLDIKFEDEPFGMFNEEHVNCFTLEALQKLFQKVGFKLIAAELNYDVHNKVSAGFPAISTIWEKTTEPIQYDKAIISSKMTLEMYCKSSAVRLKKLDEWISNIQDGERLAIWGANNLAAMLLANTCLSSKNIIKYYDSDKRKEGQTFNGKIVTPFDEDDMKNERIEGIFIASYASQEEIYKVIKPLESKIHIYRLFRM